MGRRRPPLTSWPMTGRPWLASTTSGAFGPDTASLSVLLRSVKDLATRLIVTFGYFAWNSLFRRVISAFWPPRTSWSHTVSVTSPAFEMSGLAFAVGAGVAFFFSLPGAAPHAATSADSPTAAQHRAIALLDITGPPSSLPTAAAPATSARVPRPPPRAPAMSPLPRRRSRPVPTGPRTTPPTAGAPPVWRPSGPPRRRQR